MNREEAARYVGLGTTMFDQLVKDGRMPKPVRIGSRTIWDIYDVDAAFDRLVYQTVDEDWSNPVL
jgi:predicted DNA-binding transcriptional regulator AlpA